VFDRIVQAGPEFGLRHAGFFAVNCLRMEKGYRHWGHDIGEEDTPLEAGLGFAVALDKPDGFIGRDALMRARDSGLPRKRLVQIRLEGGVGAPLVYHEEPVVRNGEIVGSVTSGGFGHRLGASLGMGYIHHEDGVGRDYIDSGTFEVEVACRRYPAEVRLSPFFDPGNKRIKGQANEEVSK
jgi:4-methylaminobutanoate oxidase (formaldehyde-forming)